MRAWIDEPPRATGAFGAATPYHFKNGRLVDAKGCEVPTISLAEAIRMGEKNGPKTRENDPNSWDSQKR